MNLGNIEISAEKIQTWVERFRYYRRPPSGDDISAWIARFIPDHVELAIKLLDSVELISEEQIQIGYRDSLAQLHGWHRKIEDRNGRWFFVGFGTTGESGPAMVRTFREANNMSNKNWHSLFIDFRELPKQKLTAYDKVVFIDDFSGSGTQIVKGWPLVQELVASEAKLFLLLTAITQDALEQISLNTELEIVANLVLPRDRNVMSDENKEYTAEDRQAIVQFGKLASPKSPCGFSDCGLLFVLSHKTPNNSLPILHANHDRWEGIFPRNLLRANR